MRGRVKFFLEDKNYGFIRWVDSDQSENEIFFYVADVVLDLEEPRVGRPMLVVGDFVEFEIGESPKGRSCAKKVKLLKAS